MLFSSLANHASSQPSVVSASRPSQNSLTLCMASQIWHKGASIRGFSTRAAAGWKLTLERSVGKPDGTDSELLQTGAFFAEVFPDLPIATTWGGLARVVTRRYTASAHLLMPAARSPIICFST